MKQYVTTATINFPAGTVLNLNADQAKSRAHLLTPTDRNGVYLAIERVQFKRGEEIGLDGEPDKKTLESVAQKTAAPKTVTAKVFSSGTKPKVNA